MGKLIVELPDEIHGELKKKAAMKHKTLKDIIRELIHESTCIGRRKICPQKKRPVFVVAGMMKEQPWVAVVAAAMTFFLLSQEKGLELVRRPGDVARADAVPTVEEVGLVGRRVDAQGVLEGLLRLRGATLHGQQARTRDDRLGEPRLQLERAATRRHGLLEVGRRHVEPPQALDRQRVGEPGVRLGERGIALDGPAEHADALEYGAVAVLAQRTGAPVIPVFALPIGIGRYRLVYEHPVAPPADDSPEAIRDFTQRCTDVLEMQVRRHPEPGGGLSIGRR